MLLLLFFGGDIVLELSALPKPFRPSVTLFCPYAYLGNGFSDCYFTGICTCIILWGRLTPSLVALHQLEIEL